MTEYKPGAVVRQGDHNACLLFRTEEGWVDAEGDKRPVLSDKGVSETARSLVVIDPESGNEVSRLIGLLFKHGYKYNPDARDVDLAAALREFANPTPPKPEEPTDPSARVRAAGTTWAKVDPWWITPDMTQVPRQWDYLTGQEDFAVE